MESDARDKFIIPNRCEFCGNYGISKCGRCLAVYYCCKEHQRQHWPIHKETCRESTASPQVSANANQPIPRRRRPIDKINEALFAYLKYRMTGKRTPCNLNVTEKGSPSNLNVTEKRSPSNLNVTDKGSPCNLNVTDKRSPSNLNVIEKRSPSNLNLNMIERGSSSNLNEREKRSPSNLNVSEKRIFSNLNVPEKRSPGNLNVSEKRSLRNLNLTKNLNIQLSLKDACMKVINDLNSRGICILDHFMGTEYGHRILLEVQDLYKKRTFEKGKLIGTVIMESVRSDVMTWISGREPECINLECLMQKIDEMVDAINKMPDRGVLSEYKLLTRTKMMVACYPGKGTHYQMHVDNPDKNGRCITFIYYVNRYWNKKQGGILRTYPTSSTESFDIEPIFDRLVIFWSDRRVPHEVLPTYFNRFAITLWYFDYDERETFKKRVSEATKSS